MSYTYLYKSLSKTKVKKWREGQDYTVWQSSDMPNSLQGPIIEIGGPTDTGYYFLDDLQLGAKPVITNIADDPMPLAPNAAELAKQVDEIMDATAMKYKDGSVGAFLMSCMSISSDWWTTLDYDAKEKAADQFNGEFDIARLEMGQVAAGILNPADVTQAQRVKIFREVHRTLRPGGLFFTDGGIEEIAIAKVLGFKLVALLQYVIRDNPEGRDVYYEFVVAKR